MLVHRRLTPSIRSLVLIYTPGWREAQREESVLPKNTKQCPQSGLERGLFHSEMSALIMRSLLLPIKNCGKQLISFFGAPDKLNQPGKGQTDQL